MSSSSIYEFEGDERPRWDDIYLTLALILSQRSTCKRASVGSVITSWDHTRVLSVGYNGNYRGGPNTCDTDVPGACGCVHGETNSIIKLNYNDPEDKRMYCTTSPCYNCAKMIIQANIREVVYHKRYRKTDGIELLQNNNIRVVWKKHIKSDFLQDISLIIDEVRNEKDNY